MSLVFKIPGEPVAWERTLPGRGHGKPVIPPATRAHMKTVRDYAHLRIRETRQGLVYPASGYFWLGCVFFLGTYEVKTATHHFDQDLDNLLKVVLDGLNGIVWHDDRQVRGFTPGTRKVTGSGDPHTTVLLLSEWEFTAEQAKTWTRLPGVVGE